MLRHRGVGDSATKKTTIFMAIGLALFIVAGAIAARGSSPLGQNSPAPGSSPAPGVARVHASAAQGGAANAKASSASSASSAKAAAPAKSGSAKAAAHVSAASSTVVAASGDGAGDVAASSGDSGRAAARAVRGSGGRTALTYGYIKGKKFHDLNANGVRDSGEPYLSGWTIKAYKDTNGNGVKDAGETTVGDSDSTDSSGEYQLTLLAGKYIVCETQQSLWVQSYPSNNICGTGLGGWAITVTVDVTSSGKDFGNYKQGKVSGEKFHDQDADGQEDNTEPGLSGWTINAYVDSNGNGVKDAGENTVATSTVTGFDGDYELFLNPGKYIICEVQQPNWVQSVPSNSICGAGAGGYAITVSSASSQSVRSGDRHVLTGGGFTEKDFGNYKKTGKTGKKFHDLNADGDKDTNEPYLAGWTINAYVDSNGDGDKDASENTIAGSAVTDANGEFTIYLGPGKYLLCEVQQAGWSQSAPSNNVCGSGIGGYAVTISGSGASSVRSSGSRSAFTGTHTNYEFGNYRKATKSGMKFHDLNANGVKDAGEPGLQGWTITAYKDTNGNGVKDAGETTVGASAVTDANGNYSMSLNPGKYVVCETQQAGWTQSYPTGSACGTGAGGWAINLAAGDIDTGNDFGNWKKGTKSGMKFHDLNGNGVKDQGEPGLAGWTITAYADANGNGIRDAGENTVAATQVTGAGGTYSLSLNPGKYVVCETQQAGWIQTAPANNVCGQGQGGWAITLTSGQAHVNNDFGNTQRATKSGTKFHDLNANGVRDQGEPGLPGWTITAYVDVNGNGIKDAGDTTVANSAVTDANGNYSMALDAGKYIVCETQQAGWTQSYPANVACAGFGGWGITLNAGDNDTGNDFGNWQKATKTGMKFHDLNANGAKDAGEPGLAGWTITAYVDANGNGTKDAAETTVAASGVTGAGGTYSLGLNPGKYIVCETLQANWFQSFPANQVCGAGMGGWAITLTSGQLDSDNDFGNYQRATKSGMKFNDLNTNGAKDQGEPGLAGWVIRAYADTNGDGTLQAGETTIAASATTAAGGTYSLTLNPGKYVVCEVAQAGWTQSLPANTKCSAISGLAPGGWAITLASGELDSDNDFGNWQSATKTGVKFHDLNANGVKDAGEPGLPGWTITAHVDANGNGVRDAGENTVAATGVTGAGGAYSLSLNPGKYVVCETQQANWTQSFPANNACGTGQGGWGITLASGQIDSDNDFGNYQKATKTGMKFHDLNGNGLKDQGEPGMAGWTITAYVDANSNGVRDAGENTVAASQVTGQGGTYSLSLNPGRYLVCETQQAGWTQTFPANGVCGQGQGGWAITLTSGQLDSDNDFGNTQQATKTGMKFHDLNRNGVKDEGEPGLAGWTITAFVDANGNGIRDLGENTIGASQVTGQGGTYSLSLAPGKYVVCETQQIGWTQSYPANAICGNGGGWAIELVSGGLDSGNDFGNWQKATKSGMKFEDVNNNGVKDQGEPGLAGWVIRAYADTNGDGVLQAGETTIAATATTGATGTYSLSLDPGKYVVCEVAQGGFTQTAPANTKCVAITGLAPGGWAINLASGQAEVNNDFGNHRIPFVPPRVCRSLKLNRHQAFIGRKVTIKATCRDQHGKGMKNEKVTVLGAGVKTSAKTNKFGVATVTITPKKVGIIKFQVKGSSRCKAQIAVRGPFRPPLTGRDD